MALLSILIVVRKKYPGDQEPTENEYELILSKHNRFLQVSPCAGTLFATNDKLLMVGVFFSHYKNNSRYLSAKNWIDTTISLDV